MTFAIYFMSNSNKETYFKNDNQMHQKNIAKKRMNCKVYVNTIVLSAGKYEIYTLLLWKPF